jgi:hypothetical protein
LHRDRLSEEVACSKSTASNGGLAQLGEHLLCKQRVNGSIPLASTKDSQTKAFQAKKLFALEYFGLAIANV